MDQPLEQALIVFIKNPVLGKVKTRIAVDAGVHQAFEIYLELCKITRAVIAEVEASIYIYYSDFVDKNDAWSSSRYIKKVQESSDLGTRMSKAFNYVLSKHRKAVIIGSDCAELDASIIQKAFDQLASHDLVVGPSSDGGYYLMGMKDRNPKLFQDIEWSTDSVLSSTLDKTKQMGLTVSLLTTLTDIDHFSDWISYKKKKS